MTGQPSKNERQVTAEEVAQLIDSLRHRPVATTAAQMRRAAHALEVTETAFQGVLKDNADLSAEIERLDALYHETALSLDTMTAERDRLRAAPQRLIASLKQQASSCKLGETMPLGRFPAGVAKYNALMWAAELLEEASAGNEEVRR